MANFLPQWEIVGEQFVQHYYSTFSQGISSKQHDGILDLYHDEAMMTFEDNKAQGKLQIKEILTNKLSFSSIVHQITKLDCQPTLDMGIVILVTGRLKTDEDQPHAFSQTFVVKAVNSGIVIMHDVFRLSLHNSL